MTEQPKEQEKERLKNYIQPQDLFEHSLKELESKVKKADDAKLINEYCTVNTFIQQSKLTVSFNDRLNIGKQAKYLCELFKISQMVLLYPGTYKKVNFTPYQVFFRVAWKVLMFDNKEQEKEAIEKFNDLLFQVSPYFNQMTESERLTFNKMDLAYSFQTLESSIDKPSYFKVCRKLERLNNDEEVVLYYQKKVTKKVKPKALILKK